MNAWRVASRCDLRAWQRATLPLVRWYVRRELPRYVPLLHRWGVEHQGPFQRAPSVEIRERFGGARVTLDLSDMYQRSAYFFGCYHEMAVLAAVLGGLRPGDVFIDGGANIGLISVAASARVGANGEVYAYEPNPVVAEALEHHVETNGLRNVRVRRAGLSDAEETLTLRLPGFHNKGAGTLGAIPDRYGGNIQDLGAARTVRADDELDPADPRPLFVKLDVEGFETRALRGMERLIETRLPTVLCEVNAEMLGHNRSSVAELHGLLAGRGYRAYALDRRGWLARRRLDLHPLELGRIEDEADALWLHPDSEHARRFARSICPAGRYWRHRAGQGT